MLQMSLHYISTNNTPHLFLSKTFQDLSLSLSFSQSFLSINGLLVLLPVTARARRGCYLSLLLLQRELHRCRLVVGGSSTVETREKTAVMDLLADDDVDEDSCSPIANMLRGIKDSRVEISVKEMYRAWVEKTDRTKLILEGNQSHMIA